MLTASCVVVSDSVRSDRRNWADDRPDVLEKYRGLPREKAMAVAIEPDGYYTWAHGHDYRHADDAIERALRECEGFRDERNISAPCELYMVNDERQP